jgi:hypothetical protein
MEILSWKLEIPPIRYLLLLGHDPVCDALSPIEDLRRRQKIDDLSEFSKALPPLKQPHD